MKKLIDIIIYFIMIGLLFALYSQHQEIYRLKYKRPETIYYVDNMAGVVTGKEFDGERYSITVSGYGKFLVTKEQYENLKVGDEIPEYLKKRGS